MQQAITYSLGYFWLWDMSNVNVNEKHRHKVPGSWNSSFLHHWCIWSRYWSLNLLWLLHVLLLLRFWRILLHQVVSDKSCYDSCGKLPFHVFWHYHVLLSFICQLKNNQSFYEFENSMRYFCLWYSSLRFLTCLLWSAFSRMFYLLISQLKIQMIQTCCQLSLYHSIITYQIAHELHLKVW